MLSFVAEFPINQSFTPESFFDLIREWVRGSRHSRLEDDELALIGNAGIGEVARESHSVRWVRVTSNSEDALAIQRMDRDRDIDWQTTIVISRRAADCWAGVRVERDAARAAALLPAAKKPVIVKMLLDRLGGAGDGILPVSNDPVMLNNNDIEFASKLILGRGGCRLPIIYVSAGFSAGGTINAKSLAKDLSGMAHVIVEPNRPFSRRLQIEVHSENVYGGAVGIYWPDEGGRRAFFQGPQFEGPKEIEAAIATEIRLALLNRRPIQRCTWGAVQELASREQLNALRESGSRDVEKYVELFDVELKAKADALSDAEKEIQRLRAELRRYEARSVSGGEISLRSGNEQDLYPGEIAECVRDAIKDASSRVQADSRREHILNALLQTLPTTDAAKSHRERIKELFRTSRDLDARARRGLEEMGFSISEEGKHYKAVFRDDDRYTFAIAKTGGDHRGGLNTASDIAKRLF